MSLLSSEQATAYLLCGECEERFNSGGETWVLKIIPDEEAGTAGSRFSVAFQRHSDSPVTSVDAGLYDL